MGALAGCGALATLFAGGLGRALHPQSGPGRAPQTVQVAGSWRWVEMWHSGNPAAFRDKPGDDAAGPEFTIATSIGGGRFVGVGYHEAEQTDGARAVVAQGVFVQAAWQAPVHHLLFIPVRERSSFQLGYVHTRATQSGVTTRDQGAEIAIQQGWKILLAGDRATMDVIWRTGLQVLSNGVTGDLGFYLGVSVGWPL